MREKWVACKIFFMSVLYLICGVSGAGKTWVCRQLQDKFHYIPHDEHYVKDDLLLACNRAKAQTKPIITECPFGERPLREFLSTHGYEVIPYFVIEPPHVVQQRYFERERKPLPLAAHTRASTIINRAREWGAPHGTSEELVCLLRKV